MNNPEVRRINKALEKYGRYINGLPFFQVVWSDDLYEMRKGTFNEFAGNIFLRTFTGIQRVRKYNYIHERWILEKFVPPPMSINPELPESNRGTYEPLYVFEDGRGNALKPIQLVCDFIVYNNLNPTMNKDQIKTALQEMIEKAEQKDIAYFNDMIENESNYFLHKLHHGESILNPFEVKNEVNSN